MIPQIKEINLPSYATLNKATVAFNDMGEKTITSQVSIDGQIKPDFSFDWEVEFKGEKYIMPLRTPQASKDNTSLSSKIDLTFQHWAIYQLKRWYFFTLQSYEAGVAVADQYIASVSLNLKNFCDLYGQMLNHYFGDKITIDLNPDWVASEEPIYIDINYSYMWDVLIKLYELFAVRWEIVAKGDPNHYVIKVGYPIKEMNHIFEYGFEGGLMKVERQVQDDNIRNMLLGRGGDKNIPYRYFKKQDPDNPTFQEDPDWVEELANVYFDRLRSAEFRSYVQGWKFAHQSEYLIYNETGNGVIGIKGRLVSREETSVPWAWDMGYSDTKFNPVEYVKDDESIRKYGELLGGLDNNDEIYPSIQGVVIDPLGRIDQVVDVEQVTSDTLDEQKQNEVDTWSESLPDKVYDFKINKNAHERIKVTFEDWKFTVPEGYIANVDFSYVKSMFSYPTGYEWAESIYGYPYDISNLLTIEGNGVAVVAIDSSGKEIGAAGIPQGTYQLAFYFDVHNTNQAEHVIWNPANISLSNISIQYGLASDNQKNQATFDIWIKNIWQTIPNAGESAEAYAERVWKPILGDHLGDEAAVCFSSGLLSTSEDYTFLILGKTISKGIHYDTTKVLNGVQSHWRLTLVRSDADYESLGKLVPNLERQGKAGDYFYFTGIELTQYYVQWAEKRLHDYKLDQLAKVSDIQPAWVVSLDKVRIGTPHYDDTISLIEQLHIGGSVRIADKRFIGGSTQLYLYLQQITYKYNESQNTANITPNVEVVLGTDYATTANPVATIQSQIDAIHNQIGGYSTSNIQQIVRMVGDRIYLRKDGITDRSQSQTYFAELLASLGFRQGMVGGFGWGFFKDENGKWVLETDRLNVREEMQVNTLVINQIQARGGMIIESAASIEVTTIEELTDAYKVYFDTKHGSLGNLFRVDDVAYCHRYTSENQDLKYYKRKVIEIGEDYITLSKTIADGHGVPSEGDVIVHFGNYTDKERQYVIVRDVMGGGYERMLSGLDSVTAIGTEYFFAGYQSSTGERLFIGNKKTNNWLEYVNGKLTICGILSVQSQVGDTNTSLEQYIQNLIPDIDEDDIANVVKDIVDPQLAEMQKQLDGVIETWFGDGEPSLDRSGYPMNQWGDSSFESHAGDLYYDNKTGYAYRFTNENGRWVWKTITDEAITKALAAAAEAKKTAEGAEATAQSKSRIFVDTPFTPYEEGDLWVNATYQDATHNYKDDILRCKSARLSGAFNIDDWGYASSYPTEIAGYAYLKEALNQSTLVDGGLVLTSLIQLGFKSDSSANWQCWSGINGIPLADATKGYGIAAWYGGDMLDKEYPQTPLPDNPRYAQSLFRFDGSGYLAGGKISWKDDGSGYLAGGKLWWSENGDLHLNNGIYIGENENKTLGSLVTAMNRFTIAFTPVIKVTVNGREITRDATWDEVNDNNLFAIRASSGFYSESFISALSLNPDAGSGSGGGGSSTLAGLDDVLLGTLSAGQSLVWNGSKWVNQKLETGGIDESLLSKYVLKSGDDMTGTLSVTNELTISNYSSLSPKLTFNISNVTATNLKIDANSTLHYVYYKDTNLTDYRPIKASYFLTSTTTLCSNLNADLLDGFHSYSFAKLYGITWNNDETVSDWAKRETGTQSSGSFFAENGWAWANSKVLNVGGYSVDSQRYSALSYRYGNLNNGWQQQAILFLPTYGDSNMIYLAQMTTSAAGGNVTLYVKRYADYDTILSSNVASANQLQNSRQIWGNIFNGTQDITGPIQTAIGESRFAYPTYADPANGISCAMKISGALAQSGGNTLLCSTSGNVGIGTTSPTRKLHMVGDGLIAGDVDIYGTLYSSSISAIAAYVSDILTTGGNIEPDVTASFDLGTSSFNWRYTYTRYVSSSQALYLSSGSTSYGLYFRGGTTTWVTLNSTGLGIGASPSYKLHVNGVAYASTGIFSSGYVSCLGQNSSSDARLKSDLTPINLSIAQIANAPSVFFKWQKDGKDDFGSIAQYWQCINPLFARKDFNDYLSLDYGKLALTSVIAIAKEVMNDKERIRQLELEVEELKTKLKGA